MTPRLGRSAWVQAIGFGTIAIAAMAGPASAQQPTLDFLETGPIDVTVPSAGAGSSPVSTGEPAATVVHVVNRAAVPATVTVVIANIKNAAGEPATSIPGLPVTLMTDATVGPGDTADVAIMPSAAVPTSATFSADLVATSSQGGLARLAIAVTYSGAPATTPNAAAPAELRKPVSDPVGLVATRFAPSFLSGLLGPIEPVGDRPGLSVAPDLASASVGALRGTSGATAEIVMVTPPPGSAETARLLVTRYTNADVYTGEFEAGTGDDATQTTIQLTVRDHVLWAVAALLVGLFAASSVESFLMQDRPRRRLQLFLAEQQDRAVKLQKDSLARRKKLPAPIRSSSTIRIFERTAIRSARGLLATAAVRALADFDSAWDRAARDVKWKPDGEGSKAYATYVDTLEQIATRVDEIVDAVRRIPAGVTPDRLNSMPVIANAKSALAGALIRKPDELTGKAKAVADAATLLTVLAMAFDQAARLRKRLVELGKLTKPFDDTVDRLSDPTVTDAPAITQKLIAIGAAYDAIVYPPGAPAGEGAEAARAATAMVAEAFEDSGVAAPFAASEEIRQALRARERRFGLLASALVLGTGLSAVYFGDASWGSLGDYLAALVWGTTVGAGLQLAKRVADRLPAAA